MAFRSCSLSCVSVRSLQPLEASLIILMQSACGGLFFLWLILGLSLVRSTTTMSSTVMRRELLISALISSSFIEIENIVRKINAIQLSHFIRQQKVALTCFKIIRQKGEAYRNALASYSGGSGQTKTMNTTRQLWSQKYRPTKQGIFESPYKQRDDSTQINITLTKSQLRSVIKEVVDRQVAPLMDRINYLQDRLNSLSESKRHRRSRHSSSESNDSDYSEQKETNFSSNTPPKSRKKFSEQSQAFQPKKSLDASMKNVIIEQVNLRIEKLRKLIAQPSLREEWYRRLQKIKKIVIDRALRNRNFLKSSEKQKIISFIQYGVNIGLDKYFLVFLIGISRASFDNWKKEFK